MTRLSPAEARIRRAHLALSLGVTLATTGAYLSGVLLTWRELPPTMATHFGLGGVADDFMATPAALLVQGIVVIGVPLLLLGAFGAARWWSGEFARYFSALLGGLSAGLCVLFVGVILAHQGIDDPTTVTLSAPVGLTAFGVGLVVALIVALVLPGPLPLPVPVRVEPLPLSPTTKASWFGRATMTQLGLAALTGGVIVVVMAAILTGIAWLWLVVVLLVSLVLGITSFEVRIDSSGLSWRGALGLPRGHIDLASIDSAAVINVRPVAYGGIGIRFLPGRLGIVTRAGPALMVAHASKQFVVTVDDPVGAASLIEGLRAGTTSRPPAGGEHR